MSLTSVVNALFKGMATGKLNPVAIAADIVVTILDGGSAGGQAEKNWETENKEYREKLIDDTLIAIKKLPTGPQFKNTKPIVEPVKNAPKPKNKPVSQPPTKFPSTPNTFAWPVDPFWVPKELVKRVRAISGTPATEQKYGEMELWPVNYEQTTFNVRLDIIGTQRREENKQKGTENFIKWFARKNGNFSSAMIDDSQLEGGGVITGDTLWDQCCYFTPQTPGDFTGPMAMEFGAAAILDRAADLASTRVNASHGGIRGVLWAKKPTINIVPSGSVDISDRLPNDQFSSSYDGAASLLKELFEYYGERKIRQLDIINQSHGQIANVIGVDQFPFFIPRSLCNHEKEDLVKFAKEEIAILQEKLAKTKDGLEKRRIEDEIEYKEGELGEIENGYVKINEIKTHAELISNAIELFSELLGAFPIKINIEPGHLLTQSLGPKDPNYFLTPEALEKTDPQQLFEVKTLKEPIKFRFPNIGELLAEIELKLLNMQGIQNLQQEFMNRFAAQMCSTQQTLVNTYDKVDCLFDWVGMKTVNHDDYITLAFDPMIAGDPENDEVLKYLIGRNVAYKKPVFAIDKDNQTLTASQFIYARACTVIMNSLYRKFNGKPGDPMENPKSFLKSAKEMLDLWNGLDGVLDGDQSKTVSISFDEFKKLFEDGYADYTKTVTDDPKPWGDDKDQRPLFNDDHVAKVGDKIYGKTRN